jgi:hypothetical protein
MRNFLEKKTAGHISNTPSRIVLGIGFIALVLFVRRVRMSTADAVGTIPFGKIGYGILALVLILFLVKLIKNKNVRKGATESLEKVNKKISWENIIGAILVFGAFNLALWAGMDQFQGEWGESYFLDTWLWSPVFILLGAIAIALAFPGGESRFGPFVAVVAVIAVLATASAIIPGFFGPEKVEAKAPRLTNRTARIVELPDMVDFNPVDSLPEDAVNIIEKYFGDLDDAVVDTMMWVVYAESRGHHYVPGTTIVLRGIENPYDLGRWQINTDYHEARCANFGYDIWEPHGNAQCARILYDEGGFEPWDASAYFWRDRYKTEPRRILTGTRGSIETVIIDAPIGIHSAPVYTQNRKYCVKVLDDMQVEVIDDVGNKFVIANNGEWSTPPRYPVWFSFRSLGNGPAKIDFSLVNPGEKCPQKE